MKIGFIGGGKMAEAMISALLSSKTVSAHEVFVSDNDKARRDILKKRYGINTYSKNKVVASGGQIMFLAIKPQNMQDVLAEIAPDLSRKNLVISIVAGWKLGAIEAVLKSARVVRVMPNIACLVREGMNVYCRGSKATITDANLVADLLGKFGQVMELPESQLDTVTALSGSGPAFFAYICELMVIAGVDMGIDRKKALQLVEQTMLGTAKLMSEENIEPLALINSVKSPQGTTAAGLTVLEKSSMSKVIQATLAAAATRSKELSAGS